MNLLLLLSALLSAITGVHVGGVRAPVAAERVVRTMQAVAVKRIGAIAHVPNGAVPPLAAMLAAIPLVQLPVSAPPLYTSRRRE